MDRIGQYIADIKAGDIEKFSYIVNQYERQIFIYCSRILNSEQDAEDAIQEIFFKAYKSIHSYKPQYSFNSWLYKIAYNHCINTLRKRKVYEKAKSLLFLEERSKTNTEVQERSIFSPAFEKALLSLSHQERSLLILHVFHEKNYQEISDITGTTSSEAVRKRISRTKMKVKKIMIEREDEEKWAITLMKTKA
ncbi:RNA polymerase sigma factor [Paenibacillus sp. Marseille-Q7038]